MSIQSAKREDPADAIEKWMMDNYMEPGMSKVLSVWAVPAVPPGDNFLSTVWRLSVTILLESGETQDRNFIIKNMPTEEEKREVAENVNAFKIEISIYELVIKKMNELMNESGDSDERPWCDFISHNNYQSILLKDLKPLGYETTYRTHGMTLEEGMLVFTSLAKFHAISKVAVHRGAIKVSSLKSRLVVTDPHYVELFLVRAIRLGVQAIEENWGAQWKDVAAKLKKPTELLVNKMIDVGRVDESRFNTVQHGDLWSNNILFQRNSSGAPKRVKFVDLQFSFYTTIGWDLTYFAFTSLSYSIRKQHINHMLNVYTDILQKDLKRYGYPTENIPSYEYILNEMKRIRFWALPIIFFYNALILTGMTHNNEDSHIIMNPYLSSTQLPEIYKNKIFKDFVAENLLELVNEGVVD